jgi:hypothetical protein
MPLMGYQEHEQTYERMNNNTTRFFVAVNYGDNVALPIFLRYPQSSSKFVSIGHSYQALSFSSRPPFSATFSSPSFVSRPRCIPGGCILRWDLPCCLSLHCVSKGSSTATSNNNNRRCSFPVH